MVICLTCFQLFRCTVLILPQKLVNKLKKPKMTKLSRINILQDAQKEIIIINISKRRKHPGSFVVEKALTAVSLL